MGKILGLDLGTNSIGIAVRNEDIEGKLVDQLEYYSSVVFKSGVGKEKTGEFSFAAQRTEKRLVRKMYQHRKYRIWETLRVLMQYGYCPLTQSEWEQWARYDKAKGLKRQYPVDAKRFEQWVRLDFDNDGKIIAQIPFVFGFKSKNGGSVSVKALSAEDAIVQMHRQIADVCVHCKSKAK